MNDGSVLGHFQKSEEWSAFALVYSDVYSKLVKLSATKLRMVVLIFNRFANSISWLGSYYVAYYMVLLFLWLFTMSLFWMYMPCLKRREES